MISEQTDVDDVYFTINYKLNFTVFAFKGIYKQGAR